MSTRIIISISRQSEGGREISFRLFALRNLLYSLTHWLPVTYNSPDSKFMQLKILIWCKIYMINIFDIPKQVMVKWKTCINFLFLILTESFLQLNEFNVHAVDDFDLMNHLPKQYFRFLTQVREKGNILFFSFILLIK